jgi:hypothetical protein
MARTFAAFLILLYFTGLKLSILSMKHPPKFSRKDVEKTQNKKEDQ